MACILAELECMSGDRSLGNSTGHCNLMQHYWDTIVIGESQVLLVVEYLWCGQVVILLLDYKSEALMPQATALVYH